jgi:hypothetical protein
MAKQLTSVADVISELGGPDAVSEMTKSLSKRQPYSRVRMWKIRERFPPKTYAVLQRELRKRGKTAPSELWGMS